MYEKYCRLMLILFKPWRVHVDLLPDNADWMNEFEKFIGLVDEEKLKIINDMQQLHECKDSKDDHFF